MRRGYTLGTSLSVTGDQLAPRAGRARRRTGRRALAAALHLAALVAVRTGAVAVALFVVVDTPDPTVRIQPGTLPGTIVCAENKRKKNVMASDPKGSGFYSVCVPT